MSNFKLTGVLIKINETEKITGKEFRKRTCVLKTKEQYSQEIEIEFVQDKCADLNGYSEGDFVTISFNIVGRAWNNAEGVTRWFNSLKGWQIAISNDLPTVLPEETNPTPF